MDANETFRTNVRRERERRGLSHRQFATLVGKTHPWTYMVETGRAGGVTLTTVDDFAAPLGLTPSRMLADADTVENGDGDAQ